MRIFFFLFLSLSIQAFAQFGPSGKVMGQTIYLGFYPNYFDSKSISSERFGVDVTVKVDYQKNGKAMRIISQKIPKVSVVCSLSITYEALYEFCNRNGCSLDGETIANLSQSEIANASEKALRKLVNLYVGGKSLFTSQNPTPNGYERFERTREEKEKSFTSSWLIFRHDDTTLEHPTSCGEYQSGENRNCSADLSCSVSNRNMNEEEQKGFLNENQLKDAFYYGSNGESIEIYNKQENGKLKESPPRRY